MSRRGSLKTMRQVDGILLLDKPTGISSNRALQRVRRLFNARKAGHTGSLDPLATGMLPICFGEATKLSGFLLDADKTYKVKCKLGMATATGDADGEITQTGEVPRISGRKLEKVLKSLLGEITQVPPMYSALKHDGKRLYQLARQGAEVERKPRKVRIDAIELVKLDSAELEFDVKCSKGTYIRVLVEDIARMLETVAHVTALRRTRSGPFGPEGMVTMDQVQAAHDAGFAALDALMLPVDAALRGVPEVRLTVDMAQYLCRGQAVLVPKAPAGGLVRIYEDNGRYLGMGEIGADGKVYPKRLVASA